MRQDDWLQYDFSQMTDELWTKLDLGVRNRVQCLAVMFLGFFSISISCHVSIDGHAFLDGSIINIDKNKIEKSRCILFL